MANLFDLSEVKNHPRRSGFDLAKRNAFTAKAGELLPVYWRFTHPGDSFELRHQSFTRTMPVNTAAFTRVREYFDWYYVPLRLLNKNIGQSLVEMYDNPVQAVSLTENRQISSYLPYTSVSKITDALCYSLSGKYSGVLEPNKDGEISLTNAFGFYTAACSYKLLQYLRYGAVIDHSKSSAPSGTLGYYSEAKDVFFSAVNLNLNVLPLLAYQKIYADYFRFSQWEKNEPYTYNVDYYLNGDIFSSLVVNTQWRDYMQDNNIFTLRYANYSKDMFMGVLPDTQLGSVSTVPISVTTPNQSPGSGILNNTQLYTFQKDADSDSYIKKKLFYKGVDYSGQPAATFKAGEIGVRASEGENVDMTTQNYAIFLDAQTSDFNILQLRMAEAVQRYREIQQCSDQDYKSQIEAHFGVKLSNALSDRCEWIGGSASNVDISEVVNTALVGEYNADIKGKGIGSGQGYEKFTCQEHGVLMCIYHAVPILDYDIMAPWKELLYTTIADVPKPEFDNIGMESLPLVLLSNAESSYPTIADSLTASTVLGYVPRYVELKTDIDQVNGAFTSTLSSWVAALNPQYLSEWFKSSLFPDNSIALNYNFFKVNPAILDSIFVNKVDSTCDTDQFLVAAYFDVKAVRNYDYDGMPY